MTPGMDVWILLNTTTNYIIIDIKYCSDSISNSKSNMSEFIADNDVDDKLYNILILYDVNNISNVMKLQSMILDNNNSDNVNEKIDIIILCMNEANNDIDKDKDNTNNNNDNIISIISLVEKICNKVIYLYNKRLDSEANNNNNVVSCNINGIKIMLNERLYIAGYDEHATVLNDINNIVEDAIDDDMLEEQEMIRQQFNINTAETTTQSINETLNSDNSNQQNGIFVFNYKYTHSLNKFLFYPEIVNTDNVRLLIIPSISEEATRLPKSYGNYRILVPKSFNATGIYHKVTMKSLQNQWIVLDISECTIII